MSTVEISLIAVEVRKWDLEAQKINLLSYFVLDKNENNIVFDVSILQPPEMVEEFLGKMRNECTQKLEGEQGEEEIEIEFDNETFLRQKLYNYFKRITSELNNPRRRKGQPKMILTTHMDIYNENQDVSFLPKHIQFYVVLNWVRKYYEREDYKRAVEPLRKLIKVEPEYGLGYKWLARSLKKIRKYDEAMRYYEKYAEVDRSLDAYLDLAKSYRKGKIFDKSEEIYNNILAEAPTNKEAIIGIAQIRYATKDERYLEILDQLHKEDPEWLNEWLVDEFNFRIYNSEKTLLTPTQAAKFMGYKQIFELTQRAFKNEIPSHFNPSKARLSFYKEELENWAMVMNRYNCLGKKVELYPNKINFVESESNEKVAQTERNYPKEKPAKNNASSTKVEEILTQIRARKAERLAQQQHNSNQANHSNKQDATKKSAGPKKGKSGSKSETANPKGKNNNSIPPEKGASSNKQPRNKKKTKTTQKSEEEVS